MWRLLGCSSQGDVHSIDRSTPLPMNSSKSSLCASAFSLGVSFFIFGSPVSLAQGTVSGKQTGAAGADANGDGVISPSERANYQLELEASGGDATNIRVRDTIDADAQLVPGSVQVGPVGIDETYSVTGNIPIVVPANAGVLVNDLDPDGGATPVLSARDLDTTGTQGSVVLNSDGSFTYTPSPGFVGSDSFQYVVRDAQGLDGLSKGVVTLNVSNGIWFVDAADTTADTDLATAGTAANPFNSLTNFSARNNGLAGNPAAGQAVFVFAGAYSGGVTLLNDQSLLGQTTALNNTSLNFALAPFSQLPSGSGTGPNPVITTTTGNAVDLASNNRVLGINVGNTPSNSFAIAGGSIGNFYLERFSCSGTGGALSLKNGGVTASGLGPLISTSSAVGCELEGLGGNLQLPLGASFNGVTTTGVSVSNSTATLNLNNLGIVGLDGANGISVTNSSNVTTSSGTVSTINNTAVEITDSTANLVLNSVSVNGLASNIASAIKLQSAPGSFRITGDGSGSPNNSGGSIANISGNAINLQGASNVELNQLSLNSIGGSAIVGRGCANVSIFDSNFTGIGSNVNFGASALDFSAAENSGSFGVSGTLRLDQVSVTNFYQRALDLRNESGSLNLIIEGGSNFANNNQVFGEGAINVEANMSAQIGVSVAGANFSGVDGSSIRFEHDSSANNVLLVNNCIINNAGGTDKLPASGGVDTLIAGGGRLDVRAANNQLNDVTSTAFSVIAPSPIGPPVSPNVSVHLDNNTISCFATSPASLGSAIQVSNDVGGDWDVLINNNNISSATASLATGRLERGIYVLNRDNGSTLDLELDNNTVTQTDAEGFRLFTDRAFPTGGPLVNNVTLTNNSFIDTIQSGFDTSLVLRLRDDAIVCANVAGNSFNSVSDNFLGQSFDTSALSFQQTSEANLQTANGAMSTDFSGNPAAYNSPPCPRPIISVISSL